MIKLNTIIAASALLACTGLVNAQSTPSDMTMPSTGASGTMAAPSSGASTVGSEDSSVTTDNSRMNYATDPYVKKRVADKAAKDEYKANKQSAKTEYKEEKRAAKTELKDARKEARTERKEELAAPGAREPAGIQPGGIYSSGK